MLLVNSVKRTTHYLGQRTSFLAPAAYSVHNYDPLKRTNFVSSSLALFGLSRVHPPMKPKGKRPHARETISARWGFVTVPLSRRGTVRALIRSPAATEITLVH